MGRLEGRIAIITGAGSGIGRSSSILFAKEGAKVVVACRSAEAGEETVRMIKGIPGQATYIKTDVSKTDDVKELIRKTVKTYGKLNILVNNAGIAREEVSIVDCTEDIFDEIVAVNFRGVWLGMKYAIPEMLRAGGGSIVNITSTCAVEGIRGMGIYSGSKGAVTSLSRVAAMEYADKNIRVNCVLPGNIATPMFISHWSPKGIERIKNISPTKRLGQPEEVAQAILFAASDESSWMTGQVVFAEGGITALQPGF
jgi:NAD(P)-dependent dehydrogenase (short-subunit alcohol dehydrogenase family)